MSIGMCVQCKGLCYHKEQAYLAWKYPSRKSSSERTMNITNYYNPKKINECVKYDSYIRVLRRRRNQNMPCDKLCSIDKTISPRESN
jgi:hypothetical protein